MDAIQKELLEQVAGLHEIPTGAYNIRSNGTSAGRNCTEHIDIITKEDGTQVWGVGKSSNVGRAGIKAVVSALNFNE